MTTKTRVKPDGLRAPYQTEGEVLTITVDGDIIASGVSGTGPHALDYHTDVTISGVADNEVLAYDSGGDWINQTAAEAGLSAVGHTHTESNITDLSHDAVAIRGIDVVGWPPTLSGQVLVYDGNAYVPDTVSGVGGMSVHDIEGAYHSLAASTSGYIMQAYSATTFGFSPLLAQDLPAHAPQSHTHIESDVTDLDHDAVKLRGVNIVDWPPSTSGLVLLYDGNAWGPGTASGASGANTFLQLTDTPSSYTSASGYYVVVTGTEDGLEFTYALPSSGIQGVDVQKDDVEEVSLATILNFEGGAVSSITDEGGGKATIFLTASGSTALGELSNVTVQDHPLILDNEVLAWDSPSQLWINQQAGEAGLSVAGHTHQHDYLTNILENDHHNKVHSIDGSDHTLASSVSGYFMQAHSATTFGFTPILAQDLPSHTHTESNITDLDHDAAKLQGVNLSAAAPASGQIMKYDGAQWTPGSASGIGATTLLQLDDTPSTYTGQGGRYLLVDQGESAIEFVTVPSGVEGVNIYNEGTFKASGVTDLDFVGEGVVATVSGSMATITISGGATASGTGGLSVYYCRVLRSTTNNFTNDWTIVWTSAPDDDESMWDSSTKIVVPYDGWAVVSANVGFTAGGGSGDWRAVLLHNGSNKAHHGDHCSDWNVQDNMSASLSYSCPVSTDDYFQVLLSNRSGSGKTNHTNCHMEVTLFVP